VELQANPNALGHSHDQSPLGLGWIGLELLQMMIWSVQVRINVFLEDELCIPFSTSWFPHHNQDLIEDVPKSSILPEVPHHTESPSFYLVPNQRSVL